MTVKEALERLKQISRGKTFSFDVQFWFHDHIPDDGVTPKLHVSVWGKFRDIVFTKDSTNLAALMQEAESFMDAYYNPQSGPSADEIAAQVEDAIEDDIDLADAPPTQPAALEN